MKISLRSVGVQSHLLSFENNDRAEVFSLIIPEKLNVSYRGGSHTLDDLSVLTERFCNKPTAYSIKKIDGDHKLRTQHPNSVLYQKN